jgi:hypothetical protein
MSGHVLHVLDDLAKAWHTDQIADAAAQHYVYDEAQEWVSPQTWTEAACVLIEADTLDQVASQGLPRRPGVVVIAHDLDDGSIYRRAASIGAENTVLLPPTRTSSLARSCATSTPSPPEPRCPGHPNCPGHQNGTDMLDDYLTEAINEGWFVLVFSGTAHQAGFAVPILITSDAWNDCVAWSPDSDLQERKGHTGQNEAGRLWHLLTTVKHATDRADLASVHVELLRIPERGPETEPRRTTLHACLCADANGRSVLMLCRPYEDNLCNGC